ncbi:hypothetical protein H9638_16345 [Arthrobacter sp. Sa2BUA2]|uniref:Uncharacterized protein n=1 Tax=Arthrobacter pullicola TaxID=2762224 RepID=A0ABR8YME8_9MICC|nr:hypothetical protein [Arthrobacter pullicola]MBD8045379.1 hypothetical protein [Arthrobacter pullicola]
MTTPSEGRRITVRMFPDYAGTVLWLGEPVGYERTGLTPELIRALQSWEESYYESLAPGLDWMSVDAAHRFTAEGNRLAGLVADELGERYDVAFTSYEDGAPAGIFHSPGPAGNAKAAAAFDALSAALHAKLNDEDRGQDPARQGEATGWYAWSPLSDTSFGPRPQEDGQ